MSPNAAAPENACCLLESGCASAIDLYGGIFRFERDETELSTAATRQRTTPVSGQTEPIPSFCLIADGAAKFLDHQCPDEGWQAKQRPALDRTRPWFTEMHGRTHSLSAPASTCPG